ncbi:MAG: alkaline phosphatase D family protein [Saprospiraceae bacterium]|nr:alkaline phosphatase D family protein [Saprospiraceae bacterium]
MMRLLAVFLVVTLGCSPKSSRTVDIAPVVPVNVPASGNEALQNGPMLGYVEMREALIWVQTQSYAAVQVEYWESGKPEQKWRTEVVQTYKQSAFTAKCIAESLEPGRSYEYRVEINGDSVLLPYPTTFKTQPLWQWRNDPPAFTLATGSCAYVNEPPYDRPGKPYGSNHQIYQHITAQQPDLMLWLGDNVYLREADWYTRAGIQHRYTHDRAATPEMKPLLASTPQYAIWDDHDYGPDDSDGTWVHKETAWEVFRDFWGNPTFGVNGQKGCTTKFQFADVDFFLLDNRYFRTPNFCKTCPDRNLLGREQLQWFLSALAASRAPYKIVAIGGQMLTTSLNNETAIRFFPAERDTILKFIERENIKGVIFLTGDRHFSELSALQNAAGNWVYDFTASPLTSGVYADAPVKEKNEYRIPGTAVGEHNFGMLRFSGPRTKREVEISVVNAEGKELWKRRLTQEGMKE